jgi:hypothetical protein
MPLRAGTSPGIVVERPEAERFSDESDRASAIAEAMNTAAIEAHREQRARVESRQRAGTCTNCKAPCLPLAVYCDTECRADDEKRQAASRRTGAMGLGER